MREVEADIWVLTETWVDRAPGLGFNAVFSPPHRTRRSSDEERFVAIWSRYPLEACVSPTPHARGTVAALVHVPGMTISLYGTVIPYGNEPEHLGGRAASPWEVHVEEVARQSSEWRAMRRNHGLPLVLAGDFNQARSGRRGAYGSARARAVLTAAHADVGLRCHTETDFVAAGLLSRSLVDHISTTSELAPVGDAMVWDRRNAAGVVLSDHALVAVDLKRSVADVPACPDC